MPRPFSTKPLANVSYLFPRSFFARPAPSLSPCISRESGPRSIAGKIRFSINALSAAMKRQSGWQPREDRRKGVKSNGSP